MTERKRPKKPKESQADQSERFIEAVRELEAAGELNRTEADERFEEAMGRIASSDDPSPSDPSRS